MLVEIMAITKDGTVLQGNRRAMAPFGELLPPSRRDAGGTCQKPSYAKAKICGSGGPDWLAIVVSSRYLCDTTSGMTLHLASRVCYGNGKTSSAQYVCSCVVHAAGTGNSSL